MGMGNYSLEDMVPDEASGENFELEQFRGWGQRGLPQAANLEASENDRKCLETITDRTRKRFSA